MALKIRNKTFKEGHYDSDFFELKANNESGSFEFKIKEVVNFDKDNFDVFITELSTVSNHIQQCILNAKPGWEERVMRIGESSQVEPLEFVEELVPSFIQRKENA